MSLLPPVVGELVMDDSRWRGPASRASSDIRDIGHESHRSTGMLGGLGKGAALLGTAFAAVGAVDFLGGAIGEMEEAQKVGAQTNAVIKSTGGAANVSAKEVGGLAGSLSKLTATDDEVIQSGQNMLLTFTNVRNEVGDGNDIFNQATTAMLDMSVALGQDTTQSAMQLGKALNDPIGGVTALRRVGVQLTDEQERSIKTMVEQGDVMGAQKVILAELTREFGGSAEAQATGLKKLSVMWGNAKEAVGEFVSPVIDLAANWLPKVGDAVGSFFSKLGDGVRQADEGVTSSGFFGTIERIGITARTVFDGVQSFIDENRATFEQWGTRVGEVFTQVVGVFQSAFTLIASIIGVYVTIYRQLWDRFGEHLWSHIQTAFNAVMQVIGGALQIIKGILDFFIAVFTGDWRGAWDAIVSIVDGAWNVISGVVKAAVNVVSGVIGAGMAIISQIWSGAWHAAATLVVSVWDGIYSAVSGAIGDLIGLVVSVPGRILGALGDLGSLLWNAGVNLIQGLIGGITSMASRAASAAYNVVRGVVRSAWDAITPGSPSKQGTAIGVNFGQGIVQGLARSADMVERAATGLVGHVIQPASGAATTSGYGRGGMAQPLLIVVQLADKTELARALITDIRDAMHSDAEGVNDYLPAA